MLWHVIITTSNHTLEQSTQLVKAVMWSSFACFRRSTNEEVVCATAYSHIPKKVQKDTVSNYSFSAGDDREEDNNTPELRLILEADEETTDPRKVGQSIYVSRMMSSFAGKLCKLQAEHIPAPDMSESPTILDEAEMGPLDTEGKTQDGIATHTHDSPESNRSSEQTKIHDKEQLNRDSQELSKAENQVISKSQVKSDASFDKTHNIHSCTPNGGTTPDSKPRQSLHVTVDYVTSVGLVQPKDTGLYGPSKAATGLSLLGVPSRNREGGYYNSISYV